MRHVRKNSRDLPDIFAGVVGKARCFSLEADFEVFEVEMSWVRASMGYTAESPTIKTGELTFLCENDGVKNYSYHVHSNLWYRFDSTF